MQAFSNCAKLISADLSASKITAIKGNTFYYNTALETVLLPETLTSVEEYAFYNCSQLKTITLPSSVKSIASNVFSRCDNLTTINVPWSEGEVSGAPWGANSSTVINYNYTN